MLHRLALEDDGWLAFQMKYTYLISSNIKYNFKLVLKKEMFFILRRYKGNALHSLGPDIRRLFLTLVLLVKRDFIFVIGSYVRCGIIFIKLFNVRCI